MTDSSISIDTVITRPSFLKFPIKKSCLIVHDVFDVIDGFRTSGGHYRDKPYKSKISYFRVNRVKDSIGIEVIWDVERIFSNNKNGREFYIELIVEIFDQNGTLYTFRSPKRYYKKSMIFGLIRRIKKNENFEDYL